MHIHSDDSRDNISTYNFSFSTEGMPGCGTHSISCGDKDDRHSGQEDLHDSPAHVYLALVEKAGQCMLTL